MEKEQVLTVGVVLSRRPSSHPWQDYAWQVADIVPGVPPEDEWRLLRETDGETLYLAGTRPLRLFRGETGDYLQNLAQRVPTVYIVLRRAEGDPERPLRAFHVTVSPAEAQDYLDGDDMVEAVPMPRSIAGWVDDYVRRFHVERPFEKQGRKARDKRRGEGDGSQGRPQVEARAGPRDGPGPDRYRVPRDG